jgi:hypothetical protein
MVVMDFPKCRQCGEGVLVPLSDFSNQGASLMYKAWVCINLSCGYNIKIRSGDVVVNEPITYAAGRSAIRGVPPNQSFHGAPASPGISAAHRR